jgi:hydrogenase-4 component B
VTAAPLLAAVAAWATGAAWDLTVGAGRRWARAVPFAAAAAGCGLVTAAGVSGVLGSSSVIHLGSTLGLGDAALRIDPLAAMFLTLIGGLGLAVSACLVGWATPEGRVGGHGLGAGYLLLLGAAVVIIMAGDAFTFLFAWEALTVAFFVLVGIRRSDVAEARASWLTLGIGKLGGAALLLGFLLLAGRAHSLAFSAWALEPSGAVRSAGFALLVVGFGAKVGLVPLQVWLPAGYPAAPGPLRAAMAGVAVNVGFYGLWRFLGILGRPPIWLAVAVLVAGGVTALLGIAFAAVESGLNRLVAFSSVENAGIILVGYGVALAGAATHHTEVIAAGLLAATLQVLAHSVAKCSLFCSCAFFESGLGTDKVESLRGIGRRYPWSAAAFGVGSITLAGLPPTIGFVSEWLVLESLLQEFRIHLLALRLAMALAGALVALTVGVALLCFTRLVGLVLLGRPRSAAAPAVAGGATDTGRTARDGIATGGTTQGGARSQRPVPSAARWRRTLDGGAPGRAGMLALAVPCVALAAVAPWVLRFAADGLAPVVPHSATIGALKAPWVIQPVFGYFSALSPSWLLVILPIGVAASALAAVALSGGNLLRSRRVPAWRSATPGVAGPATYSAFGYANPLRHVLANVLGSRRSTVSSEPRAALEGPPSDRAHIEVRTEVVEPVETYLYRPARAAWLRLAGFALRLQSGRLDAYVAYMLFALVVLLAVVAVMG